MRRPGSLVVLDAARAPTLEGALGLDTSLDVLNGEAHAAFLQLREAALAQGLDFTVRSTRRTCAQQAQLYAIGRSPGDTRAVVTHAKGCVSWHVSGRAIDVTMTQGSYDALGALAKSMGWKWGGDFPGFPDVGHIEWHPGLTIADVCPNPDHCVDTDVDTALPPDVAPPGDAPSAGSGSGSGSSFSPILPALALGGSALFLVWQLRSLGFQKDSTMFTYQTLDDGTVQTLNADGTWHTPWPSDAEIAKFDKDVAHWFDMVSDAVARYGLPPQLIFAILAIIYSESGGIANIGPSFDNGVGLMAITAQSLKAKPGGGFYTAQELKDPALNIDIGVGKMIAPEYAVMGLDLPQIASGFNAGFGSHGAHARPDFPWGWKEYTIPATGARPYISKVVRINNYAISRLAGLAPNEPTGDASPDDSGSSGGSGLPGALAISALALAVFWATLRLRSLT